MQYSGESIGKRIYSRRKSKNLSQAQLGKAVAVTGKQISNYEKGKLLPPIDVLLNLCEPLGCELGYLLGEEDYSENTRLRTAIVKTTGLTSESLDVLEIITGSEKECLSFGFESSSYQAMLNNLITSPKFLYFIERLHDLDALVQQSENVWIELEESIGKDRLMKTRDIYNSSIDYEHDCNAPKLEQEQIEDYVKYDSATTENGNLLYAVRIARYELQEAFTTLIESVYPR